MEEQNLKNALETSECLSIEQLGRFADDALAVAERSAAEAHIGDCANCQSELVLLDEFKTLSIRDDEAEIVRGGVEQLNRRWPEIVGDTHKGTPWLRRWMSVGVLRPALATAAVLVAIAGGYYLTQPASRLPAGLGLDVTRSSRVAVEGPIGDQASVPDRLQWQTVSGALTYRVRLTEVDRHEIWSTDTTAASIELPPSVRAQIVPGKTLLWQVTAIDASNAPIAESEPLRFRVTR